MPNNFFCLSKDVSGRNEKYVINTDGNSGARGSNIVLNSFQVIAQDLSAWKIRAATRAAKAARRAPKEGAPMPEQASSVPSESLPNLYKHLYIPYLNYDHKGGDDYIKKLGAAIGGMKELEAIFIPGSQGFRLGEVVQVGSCKLILHLLQKGVAPSLKSLSNVGYTTMNQDDARSLARLIAQNNSLEELRLSLSVVGYSYAFESDFINAFESNTTLTSIVFEFYRDSNGACYTPEEIQKTIAKVVERNKILAEAKAAKASASSSSSSSSSETKAELPAPSVSTNSSSLFTPEAAKNERINELVAKAKAKPNQKFAMELDYADLQAMAALINKAGSEPEVVKAESSSLSQ